MHRIRSWWSCLCFLCLSATLGAAHAATGTVLQGSTLYPRVVRLEHGPANTYGRLIASTNGIIFQSNDNGANWNLLGPVPTAAGSTERCCATLYELPQQVGSLAAGTLISAASYFSGNTPAVEVYVSTNQGASWTYHSTPVLAGDGSHGLWEPEFSVASDGALECAHLARPSGWTPGTSQLGTKDISTTKSRISWPPERIEGLRSDELRNGQFKQEIF